MKAPLSAECIVCAKICTRDPRVESTSACSEVNGAQTATSTPAELDTRGSSPWM